MHHFVCVGRTQRPPPVSATTRSVVRAQSSDARPRRRPKLGTPTRVAAVRGENTKWHDNITCATRVTSVSALPHAGGRSNTALACPHKNQRRRTRLSPHTRHTRDTPHAAATCVRRDDTCERPIPYQSDLSTPLGPWEDEERAPIVSSGSTMDDFGEGATADATRASECPHMRCCPLDAAAAGRGSTEAGRQEAHGSTHGSWVRPAGSTHPVTHVTHVGATAHPQTMLRWTPYFGGACP